MKKETTFSTKGHSAAVGSLSIQRMLPNQYAAKVGPFVFLDYVRPVVKEVITKNGMGAHPHRGIATLTYILQGKVEHFDSAGNEATIRSGGAQWMKAGNGIIHDENLNYDSLTESKFIQGFQFWINLPAGNKAEKPAHMAIQAAEIPKKTFPNENGWLKVVVGSYEDLSSEIPNYSKQFLYHIQLKAGTRFSLTMESETEVAAFLPAQNVILNDTEFQAGEFIEFDRGAGEIEINNPSLTTIDVLLFGGEEYTEPVVAEGPFVMNSQAEIATAYRDFYAGRYGEIKLTAQK
ncbi:pirin family protein [Mucilaginibacter pocheonensis]|uniref:Redox-sensitive bicupin YhaK (Pirin superfamily) n=1 Tax=Mucilaginibacter pocheonensis TaxID=398050 RepID=A0ABU1TFQ8_9SPHI|nr:pirin family protein [Mucilaginibacter pocheonensis]MDR6944144.1 redox-sensitive bicupin YhaK (pirin superfamily) [Mucilaginibacter pocheonensis]